MTQILVFGDSIAYGAWDKEGGWVERLRKFLAEKTIADSNSYYLVYNLSISGDRIEWLLERFESEAQQRLEIIREEGEDEEVIFILAIRINDTKIAHINGESLVSAEQFQDNIQKLVNMAKKHSPNIVFIGLTSVDESKLETFTAPLGYSYKNKQIQIFNNIIKTVCTVSKVHFIDVFNEFNKKGYEKLLEDGLHPNSNGHQKIFELVKEFLVKNSIV